MKIEIASRNYSILADDAYRHGLISFEDEGSIALIVFMMIELSLQNFRFEGRQQFLTSFLH